MPEHNVSLEQVLPLIQECLAAGQDVSFTPRGISMQPMLRNGQDSVVLSPVNKPLKKYDLPLYRRPDGQFVLHRIVAVTGGQPVYEGDRGGPPSGHCRGHVLYPQGPPLVGRQRVLPCLLPPVAFQPARASPFAQGMGLY